MNKTVDTRELVGHALWGRLVVKAQELDPSRDPHEAVDRGVGFLVRVAREGSEGQRPTKLEDLGWHAFLLFTREYAEFCQRIAGRFIHHAPDDSGDCGEVGCGAGRPPE